MLVAHLGQDQRDGYLTHLQSLNINLQGVMEVSATAQGYVFTFADKQQLTAFYPGTAVTKLQWEGHLKKNQAQPTSKDFAVMAPFPTPLTQASMAWLSSNIPLNHIVWNPGQYSQLLTEQEYLELANGCGWLVANATEMDFLDQLHPRLEHINYVRTDGAEPIQITTNTSSISFEVPPSNQIVDPTGCGDAFTAGMTAQLHQLNQSDIHRWPRILRRACLQAQACLAQQGTQCH